MVTAQKIEIAPNDQPQTRLKVVRDSKPADNIPISPYGPATALKSKRGNLWWQLQLDFSKPLEALIRPKGHAKTPTKARKPRKPYEPKPKTDSGDGDKKLNRLQKLKMLANTETEEQKAIRLQKGERDRAAFLEWIGSGIDHLTHEPVYKRFSKIARSETLRALNKTRTLRGLDDIAAEQIWMDFYHTTVMKVAEALGDGVHEFTGGIVRFDDYFFAFIKADAKRNVQDIDKRNVDHSYIYRDYSGGGSHDDDTRDTWGTLGAILSESPAFMEGRIEEFREYAYYEIFKFVENNYVKTDADWRDLLFFTTYYGGRQTLEQVSRELKFSTGAISKGRDRVKAFVQQNMDWEAMQVEFGKRIMEGCNCG